MTRNHYKALAERRAAVIRKLTKQLSAEKQLNNALSKMAFLPKEKQELAKLRQLRRATTIKQKLAEGKKAA